MSGNPVRGSSMNEWRTVANEPFRYVSPDPSKSPYAQGQGGTGTTWFVPFTGTGIEPLDGRRYNVDMNRNGVWDFVETPTQAWRRLGLLQKDEALTPEKYTACVQAAAQQLVKDGFFSAKTAAAYVDQAKKTDIAPKVAATQ